MSKDYLVYIDHILESITKIEEYTSNLSKEEFFNNELIQDAVIRKLEIVGEATKRIPSNIYENYTDIPWLDMARMRDKLIHHYLEVDLDIVWKTIIEDIPNLKTHLEKIK